LSSFPEEVSGETLRLQENPLPFNDAIVLSLGSQPNYGKQKPRTLAILMLANGFTGIGLGIIIFLLLYPSHAPDILQPNRVEV
jgi:hypothetical protein